MLCLYFILGIPMFSSVEIMVARVEIKSSMISKSPMLPVLYSTFRRTGKNSMLLSFSQINVGQRKRKSKIFVFVCPAV